MRRGIFIQLSIIFVILAVANYFEFAAQKRLIEIDKELLETPILFLDEELDVLCKIKSILDSSACVDQVLIDSSDDLKRKLTEKHNLGEAESIIEKTKIKNLARAVCNAQILENDEDFRLFQEIKKLISDADIRRNEQKFDRLKKRLNGIKNDRIAINATLVLSLVFIVVFMGAFYENKNDKYWLILRKSGGNMSLRSREFAKSSFILAIVPIVANIAFFFIQKKQPKLNETEIIFVGGLMIALAFSRIILRIALFKKEKKGDVRH